MPGRITVEAALPRKSRNTRRTRRRRLTAESAKHAEARARAKPKAARKRKPPPNTLVCVCELLFVSWPAPRAVARLVSFVSFVDLRVFVVQVFVSASSAVKRGKRMPRDSNYWCEK